MSESIAICPDCGVRLPAVDGPTHRYIGASAACWGRYSALLNAGQPPLAPQPLLALLVDAYAAQHPGQPSPPAIQSVAIHLLTLYGVLEAGQPVSRAIWLRRRAAGDGRQAKQGRFSWLTPPAWAGSLTVANTVAGATPAERGETARQYVTAVWERWAAGQRPQIVAWYERYITGR